MDVFFTAYSRHVCNGDEIPSNSRDLHTQQTNVDSRRRLTREMIVAACVDDGFQQLVFTSIQPEPDSSVERDTRGNGEGFFILFAVHIY